ncbi:VWA domain-containing protein, partial [Neiella marina]
SSSDDDADSSEGDSSSDDDADSSEGDSSSEGGNSAMRCSAAAQQMLDATEDEYIDDIHDMVRAGLEQDADEAQRAGDVVDGIDNQPFQISRHNVCGVMDKSAAIQASRRVKNPLHRVLFDMNKTERSYRRRGSNLDSDRLATVPAGTRNVFKHEQTTRAPNTAVSILVDNSDSMSWACTVNGVFHPENWKMETANACTYALSYSLHKLPGVTNEVLYYPRGYEGIHVAKSFSEKSAQPKNFEVNATGGTPTGPAMMAAIARLAVRDEPRKLLFVLTDGDPNSTVAVEQALEVALVTGVKVVAIGVGTNHVSGFDESGFVCVEDISTLHLAVKEAIAQSLLSVA